MMMQQSCLLPLDVTFFYLGPFFSNYLKAWRSSGLTRFHCSMRSRI